MVERTGPFDFRIQRDLNALVSHDLSHGFKNTLVKGVQHVNPEIVVISFTLVASGQTTGNFLLLQQNHLAPRPGKGQGGVEAARAATQNDDRRGRRKI
ncbi:MAG: hypothetical protein R3F31_10720 [Verrucomicrobiales bacterium]